MTVTIGLSTFNINSITDLHNDGYLTAVDGNIIVNTTSLVTEPELTAAVATLNAKINAETSRAELAESTLSAEILAEINRATTAEASLLADINAVLPSLWSGGTFGSSTSIPVITIDQEGRTTAVGSATPSAGISSITATGDVTGTSTTGNIVLTLNSVTAGGTFGSVSIIPVVIVNSKGLVTSVTNTPINLASNTAAGTAPTAAGSQATAVGRASSATGTSSIALGFDCIAGSASFCQVLGSASSVNGQYSTTIGCGTGNSMQSAMVLSCFGGVSGGPSSPHTNAFYFYGPQSPSTNQAGHEIQILSGNTTAGGTITLTMITAANYAYMVDYQLVGQEQGASNFGATTYSGSFMYTTTNSVGTFTGFTSNLIGSTSGSPTAPVVGAHTTTAASFTITGNSAASVVTFWSMTLRATEIKKVT